MRKHKRAEMTFTGEAEIAAFDAICAELGYSRSDVLRYAVNKAFKLKWLVPVWRKAEGSLSASGKSKRKSRSRKKDLTI